MRGLLPIWKEKGMTSHDVVFKLRKILKMKRIGHTGTLDPDVEGVLLVCLGEATKLVELLMEGEKVYRGQVTLGFSTETEDASGEVIERLPVSTPLSHDEIDRAMQSFIGKIEQVPPYYSAVKVNGKRLYEYARQGIPVERPKRQVEIFDFTRVDQAFYHQESQTQTWGFDVTCSKGTYVRTLAVDLGAKLGYPAHMSSLIRLATGGYSQSQSLTLSQVERAVQEGTINQAIFSIESALQSYPSICLNEVQFQDIKVGKVLDALYFGEKMTEPTSLFFNGKVVAIYYPHPKVSGSIKPYKMFVEVSKVSE